LAKWYTDFSHDRAGELVDGPEFLAAAVLRRLAELRGGKGDRARADASDRAQLEVALRAVDASGDRAADRHRELERG